MIDVKECEITGKLLKPCSHGVKKHLIGDFNHTFLMFLDERQPLLLNTIVTPLVMAFLATSVIFISCILEFVDIIAL